MFHDIADRITACMRQLEEIDARDRKDGTSRMERLRQIPRETGRFLAILAATAPAGACIEIGTSAGYSALWLALACRTSGRRLTTFEVLPAKADLAKKTFQAAGVEDCVELIAGDAREHLTRCDRIGFCFLDAEKESYQDCYDLVVPRLVPGGLLVVDNVISHAAQLQPFIEHAMSDARIDAVVVPIGKGELLCRKR